MLEGIEESDARNCSSGRLRRCNRSAATTANSKEPEAESLSAL